MRASRLLLACASALLWRPALPLLLHHSVLLASTQPAHKSDIVVLHGLLGSARNFNSFARVLHQKVGRAHNIVAMDLRGHGRSHADEGSLAATPTESSILDYEDMARDVRETLDYLGIASAHLVGHSMGGKTASVLALRHPLRVRSLAVLDIRCLLPSHMQRDYALMLLTL